MWYPTQDRANAIERTIQELEHPFGDPAPDQTEFLTQACSAIRDLIREPDIPDTLARDWLKIASQYRLYETQNLEIRRAAGAGLLLLVRHAGNILQEQDGIATLRWATDTVRGRINRQLPKSGFHKHLAEHELLDTTRLWEKYKADDSMDLDTIVARVQPYLGMVSDMSSDFYFPAIRDQVRDLLAAAFDDGPVARSCRAALRYLCEKDDTISDDLGYVGLLDDLYVIELAHRELSGQSDWSGLLNRFVAEWPCIEQMGFDDSGSETSLPPFMQMTAGATLSSLGDHKDTLIALHEVGPTALTGAFFATVESLRLQHGSEEAERSLTVGDHILLGDEAKKIKAIYEGEREIYGQKLVFVTLAKDARQGLPPSVMPMIRRSPKQHNRLSTLKSLHDWMKEERPQLLQHFVGGEIHPDRVRSEVVLVMPRQELDEHIGALRPMGSTIPELVGCQYVARTGGISLLHGTQRATPLLTVCSDAVVAGELLGKATAEFSPQNLICDATTMGSAELRSMIESAKGNGVTTVMVAPMHARDVFTLAQEQDFRIWPLSHDEVEPGALGTPVNLPRKTGVIRRYIARQRLSGHVENRVHLITNNQVQELDTVVEQLRKRLKSEEDGSLINISILASELLNLLRTHVLDLDAEHARRVNDTLSRCKMHADPLAIYDSAAANLVAIIKQIGSEDLPTQKKDALTELLSDTKAGRTTLLCPSQRAAIVAREVTQDDPVLSNASWLTLREIRGRLPTDRLLVPAWLGRAAMREIAGAGFARQTEYLFYPFEVKWYERSNRAAARHQNEIEKVKTKLWAFFEEKFQGLGSRPAFPETDLPVIVAKPEEQNSDDEEEWLAAAIHEAVRRISENTNRPEVVTKARLMLFEDPQYYVYVPPNGKVICLSALVDRVQGTPSLTDEQRDELEDLVTLPVGQITAGHLLAFPLDATRDALDILSDRFMSNSGKTRRYAALWREALNRFAEENNFDVHRIVERLSAVGLRRTPQTIRTWLYSTRVIAPFSWRDDISIIAELTQDERLIADLDKTLSAIPKMYTARRKAAIELVKMFVDQDLDLESNEATLKVGSQDIHYKLLRVKSVGQIEDVADQHVGVLVSLLDEPIEKIELGL